MPRWTVEGAAWRRSQSRVGAAACEWVGAGRRISADDGSDPGARSAPWTHGLDGPFAATTFARVYWFLHDLWAVPNLVGAPVNAAAELRLLRLALPSASLSVVGPGHSPRPVPAQCSAGSGKAGIDCHAEASSEKGDAKASAGRPQTYEERTNGLVHWATRTTSCDTPTSTPDNEVAPLWYDVLTCNYDDGRLARQLNLMRKASEADEFVLATACILGLLLRHAPSEFGLLRRLQTNKFRLAYWIRFWPEAALIVVQRLHPLHAPTAAQWAPFRAVAIVGAERVAASSGGADSVPSVAPGCGGAASAAAVDGDLADSVAGAACGPADTCETGGRTNAADTGVFGLEPAYGLAEFAAGVFELEPSYGLPELAPTPLGQGEFRGPLLPCSLLAIAATGLACHGEVLPLDRPLRTALIVAIARRCNGRVLNECCVPNLPSVQFASGRKWAMFDWRLSSPLALILDGILPPGPAAATPSDSLGRSGVWSRCAQFWTTRRSSGPTAAASARTAPCGCRPTLRVSSASARAPRS